MTTTTSRVIVTGVFALLYLVFLAETIALFLEFGADGLALPFATIYAHNFIFFPIAGLLAFVAFWRPAVLLGDALGRGKIRGGRLILGVCMVGSLLAAAGMANSFNDSNSRSLFEIAPQALVEDEGTPQRAAIGDVLTKMRIMATGESGLTPYRTRCDEEWLTHSPAAQEPIVCFPTGKTQTVASCCAARTVFRRDINALYGQNVSRLATVHRWVLLFKCFFLILLFAIGVLLVRFRKPLHQLYGSRLDDVSFGLAMGGLVMLIWPLLNAAYLDTFSLLTADGSTNAYSVAAPLITLGFGVWVMLLVFFHLRSYPSQVEYAAKLGGLVVAGLGVLQYEQIISYLSRTLGIGGGVVALTVFTVGVGVMISTVVLGVQPRDFDLQDMLNVNSDEDATAEKTS